MKQKKLLDYPIFYKKRKRLLTLLPIQFRLYLSQTFNFALFEIVIYSLSQFLIVQIFII